MPLSRLGAADVGKLPVIRDDLPAGVGDVGAKGGQEIRGPAGDRGTRVRAGAAIPALAVVSDLMGLPVVEVVWSPDDRRFVFKAAKDEGPELWLTEDFLADLSKYAVVAQGFAHHGECLHWQFAHCNDYHLNLPSL